MYNIIEWSQDKFSDSREEWSALLKKSAADSLFMSWEWQYTWWEKYAATNNLTLLLLAAYDEEDQLVGIAPLFTSIVTSKKILKLKRVQFIGNCWRGPVTMRTEKVDFVIKRNKQEAVLKSFFEYLSTECTWDEFLIPDLLNDSATFNLIKTNNRLYRVAEKYNSYYLALPESFEGYLKNLGKNTRLQIFNRRKNLAAKGDIEVRHITNNNIEDCFELLNKLHMQRWGDPAFQNRRLEFNLTVAKLMAETDGLHFIVLYVNKEPVSIQYNYRVAGVEYNIQAGFNENFDNKIPLGYLLFGYAIEDAIKSGIKTYDFLAGMGKNAQYKSRLTNQTQQVVDIQIFRSRWLAYLYKLYDFIRK